ncbi:hypoxanthine phosphoribosyltransferase [Gehongia tenuis]|jgi:hypoxanthine phosphoribosyltransferase|uniref:Hypoxanthine phosphoribosyltransferase n=1 Tax=Gehongia tenuis TaxID=2763655 RepID=A0A926D5W9_9FIRM|nr:hypoxanthine phosphoribosyltransferase [Gehongia tenuis]
MTEMMNDVAKVLCTQEEIEQRVQEMGQAITRDFSGSNRLIVVGILKGAVVYYADLIRHIGLPMAMDFMMASSYGSSSVTSGVVNVTKDLENDIEGQDVLIVEDIIDTGLTLSKLKQVLLARNPNSLKICCLLDKPERRKVDMKADYVGFSIPDEFVVGYGLDYNERYRNLPDICVLKPEIYAKD